MVLFSVADLWPWPHWATCLCEQRSRAASKWKVSSQAFLCRRNRSDSRRSLRSAPAGPESSSSTWRGAGMSELMHTDMTPLEFKFEPPDNGLRRKFLWACVANAAIFCLDTFRVSDWGIFGVFGHIKMYLICMLICICTHLSSQF